MMATLVVRRGTLADLPFVADVVKPDYQSVGFLPRAVYEHLLRRWGDYALPNYRIWVAEAGGDRVGFLYATPGAAGQSVKVVQIVLRRDARRQEYGTALVSAAEQWARALQRPGVSCRTRVDLDSRAFWDALGYPATGIEVGGKRLGRVTSSAVLERRYRRLPCGLLLATETEP